MKVKCDSKDKTNNNNNNNKTPIFHHPEALNSCLPAVHNYWARTSSVALVYFPKKVHKERLEKVLKRTVIGNSVNKRRWKISLLWRTGEEGKRKMEHPLSLHPCCTHTYQWSFLWLCNWTQTTSCKSQKWHWEVCYVQGPTDLHQRQERHFKGGERGIKVKQEQRNSRTPKGEEERSSRFDKHSQIFKEPDAWKSRHISGSGRNSGRM